jgi:hypothetical protein
MREITWAERALFAVIGVAALFVAYLGLFRPVRMDTSFTWALLPPLHARFVGVAYLFGGVFMIGCLLARHRSAVAPALPAIGIFTSLLLLVTLLNLEAFDYDLGPPWVWTVSYVVYPILAFTLGWLCRDTGPPVPGSPLDGWARTFLFVQAGVFGVLGLGLLVAREVLVDAWPWPISNGVAQFYGGPFLAYAYCSWAYARKQTWTEVAPVVPAMLVFTAGTVVVSLIHDELFSAGDVADWVWFVGFTAAAAVLAAMAARLVQLWRQAPRAARARWSAASS